MNHDDFVFDEVFDEHLEQVSEARATILAGFLNYIVTTLVYSLGVFLGVRILKSADVIAWRLSWTECTSLVGGFNFLRIWDRAFFK